jgi:hypothetical protein
MKTRNLLVAGAAAVLVAAGGTGIALAATSATAAVPAAVPASAPAADTPEPGDTPDAPAQQGADAPEAGDTPDAPGQG